MTILALSILAIRVFSAGNTLRHKILHRVYKKYYEECLEKRNRIMRRAFERMRLPDYWEWERKSRIWQMCWGFLRDKEKSKAKVKVWLIITVSVIAFLHPPKPGLPPAEAPPPIKTNIRFRWSDVAPKKLPSPPGVPPGPPGPIFDPPVPVLH